MSGGALRGRSVLLVEDESLVSMLAEDLLFEAGCEVILAMELSSALEAASRTNFDCAVLDVNLGGGTTSFPVAAKLAERDIPFVFVTGYGAAGVAENYSNATIIQKPYRGPELLEALCATLSRD